VTPYRLHLETKLLHWNTTMYESGNRRSDFSLESKRASHSIHKTFPADWVLIGFLPGDLGVAITVKFPISQ
jgi:hypothetical protein